MNRAYTWEDLTIHTRERVASLREQIAQEIEAKHSRHCQYQVQHYSEQGYNDFTPSSVEVFDKCTHVEDANIARGKASD